MEDPGFAVSMPSMDPWDFPSSVAAPSGSVTLEYLELHEFRQESPLSGRLRLPTLGVDFGAREFGGPPVWSAGEPSGSSSGDSADRGEGVGTCRRAVDD
jgi:hypothetical protein